MKITEISSNNFMRYLKSKTNYLLQRENLPFIIFFSYLFIGLFLGDGIQHPIDIWMGICIVIMYLYARVVKLPAYEVPRIITRLWLLLLLYLGVRTLFSESVGLSISTTVRYIEIYLVFHFFSTYLPRKIRLFTTFLVTLSLVASGISLLLLFFPTIGRELPGMNLLYAQFGHNQIASLLLISFPLVLERFLTKQSVKNVLVFVLYFFTFITSFSRGAYVLLLVYFGYQLFVTIRKRKLKKMLVITSVSLLFGILLLSQVILSGVKPEQLSFLPPNLKKQIYKQYSIVDSRWQYWQQAWHAFKDNPVFGHGPGTFFLLSKRYQTKPDSNTYYAHSLPLELSAELGLVGLGLFGLLLINVVKQKHLLKADYDKSLLFKGLLLSLIYSFIEFNLNFLIVLLIFWAGMAVMITNKGKLTNVTKPHIFFTLIAILIYYCASSITSQLLVAQKGGLQQLSFFLTPYDRFQTTKLLNSSEYLPEKEMTNISYFHNLDPEISFLIATKNTRPLVTTLNHYKKAVKHDPHMYNYYQKYLSFLLENNLNQEIFNTLKILTLQHAETNVQNSIAQLNNFEPDFSNTISNHLHFLLSDLSPKEALQKTYYFLGLAVLPKNPQLTNLTWRLARDIFPNWGYYHMEYAALHYYTLHDSTTAQQILKECENNQYTRDWCKETEVSKLPLPGSFHQNINAIPKILD